MRWDECADTEQVVLEAVFTTWARQAGLNYMAAGHDPEPFLHYVVLTRADAGEGARYTLELVDPSTGGTRRLSAAVMRPEQVLRVLPLMLIDGDQPWGDKVAPARLFHTGGVVPREGAYQLADPHTTVVPRCPNGGAPNCCCVRCTLVRMGQRVPEPCEPCHGRGWLISHRSDGIHALERCDTCKVFGTDDDAADAARTWVRSHE